MNAAGSVLNSSEFDDERDFVDGMAAVCVNSKWGYINQKGEIISRPQWDQVHDFSEDIGVVNGKDGYGFLDKSGKVIVQPKFFGMVDCSEGLIGVAIDNSNGGIVKYLDKDGNEKIVKNDYCLVWPFHDGLALVDHGLIDRSGKSVFPMDWYLVGSYNKGLIKYSTESERTKSGLMDYKGKILSSVQWNDINDFINHTAVVEKKDHYGLMNDKGIVLSNAQCDDIKSYDNHKAFVVTKNDYEGVMNNEGKLIIPVGNYKFSDLSSGVFLKTSNSSSVTSAFDENAKKLFDTDYKIETSYAYNSKSDITYSGDFAIADKDNNQFIIGKAADKCVTLKTDAKTYYDNFNLVTDNIGVYGDAGHLKLVKIVSK